ncbi:FAD-dependent monooxygenase [Streptosporangium sp. NPDC004379]|uniref:FAD-dependent monooxygenase n=1 Tax=Streptosporangium sp. NPDC004379 TaxID=3366189 RepID=UPI0036BCAEF1
MRRAVICGAGIAGLAAAQRLDAHGWDVVVVEKAPGPRSQGYMIDFFGLGYDAARRMGTLPRLKELGYRLDGVRYLDEAGRSRARLDYERFGRVLDGRLLSVMRPDLELALREQVEDRVDLRYGSGVTGVENLGAAGNGGRGGDGGRGRDGGGDGGGGAGVRVTLGDGTTLDADLLIGADGVHSAVRRLVFGEEERFLRYLGFHTAAYVFDDPEIYKAVDGRFCLTDTVGRQMGLYGLRDGRVAVFTVHRSADPALPEDAREAVRRACSTLGWLVPRALERCPEPSEVYYDQVAQIEMPRWNSGRVTLLGDACGAVSLLAGQGASLAVAGAYLLGERLAAADPSSPAASPDSVESALAGYQEQWLPVVTEKQKVGRSGVEWFLPSSPARLRLRRIALRLMNLPGLDRYFGTALIGKSGASLESLSGSR